MTIDTKRVREAVRVLRENRLQIDRDGTMIGVSREAVEVVLDEIDRLKNSDTALGLIVDHLRNENGGLIPSWVLDLSDQWSDKRVPELE